MIGIIIVSHGNLGHELLKAAELICGEQEHVVTLGLQAQDAIESLPGRITEAIDKLCDMDGILILVDLFGGSPGNATLRCIANKDLECISGVNLPMLLEVLMQREHMSAKELADLAVQAGRDGVRNLGEALRQQLRMCAALKR